jgi:trk system potassium uptake protein TrkA
VKTIIVGAGMVGSQLAKHLIQEGDEVTLLERDGEVARHASNRLDCLVIQDAGNSLSALEEAGIAAADALVCVTDSDEVNIITCALAAAKYPRSLKIARVRNDEYAQLGSLEKPLVGIDRFVHPDVEAAKSVLRAIEHGALGDVLAFGDTPYTLGSIDVAEESAFAGKSVRDFRSIVGGDCLVTLIERGEESLIPSGGTSLLIGDRVHALAREEELAAIFRLAGRKHKPLRKIGVVGGGRLGALIAEGLFDQAPRRGSAVDKIRSLLQPKRYQKVVVIEKDYGRCKELAERFPAAIVMNEDISDEGFVEEEGIDDLDLIIAATEDQEQNMITALYLKSRGVDRAVALVSGTGYAAIARRLGIDVVVPIKTVVVDSILSQLLGGSVRGVHRLGAGAVEILEMEVAAGSALAGVRLADFRMAAAALVMLVSRGADAFIPKGDTAFVVGDRVALIVARGGEAEAERLFAAGT